MTQNNLYNTKLTKEPFSGTNFKSFSRKLCDENEKVMGSISGKQLKDLNNKVIARLESKDTVTAPNGKKKKVAVYKSVEGNDTFRVEGNALFLNDSPIGSAKPMIATVENFFTMSIMALALALVALVVVVFMPFAHQPVVEITDNNGSWSAQKNIAVFDKTLKPGTNGEYSFVIRNSQSFNMSCSIEFVKIVNNVDTDYFPLEFQLLMNNQVVGGGWQSIDDFKFDDLTISSNSDLSFCLQWRWQFESGHDSNDTELAIHNGSISIQINVQATAD